MKKRGKFIVIEGIDGSGKTTLINNIAEYFKRTETPFLTTKEPTESIIGRLATSVIRKQESLCNDALALIFAADRAEHLEKEIKPAIDVGKIVFCDRYVYSNMAYQGYKAYEYNKTFLLKPDLTVFLDTTPKECTKRIALNRMSMEIYDGIHNAERIRQSYFEMFAACGDELPVTTMKGNCKENEVFERFIEILRDSQLL
ncbi:MAG: dTMP kinase [Turicibacter sp.]|nr:dTMP kinase [Turicibacter sp.]